MKIRIPLHQILKNTLLQVNTLIVYNSTIDNNAPIVSEQIDITIDEGESDTLSWTISDNGLSWEYIIELDNEAVQSGY